MYGEGEVIPRFLIFLTKPKNVKFPPDMAEIRSKVRLIVYIYSTVFLLLNIFVFQNVAFA